MIISPTREGLRVGDRVEVEPAMPKPSASRTMRKGFQRVFKSKMMQEQSIYHAKKKIGLNTSKRGV